MTNVRKLALEALYKIMAEKAYANLTVNRYLNRYKLEAMIAGCLPNSFTARWKTS